tara:strand:- start:565 stop:822 length:258 start_codon:yes stop_codon:yes gene_type:complete
MFEYKGRLYAADDQEMIDSVFNGGRTCAGFYEHHNGGTILSDLQHDPRVFVWANGRTVTTCHRIKDGRIRFVYGICTLDEEWLNA